MVTTAILDRAAQWLRTKGAILKANFFEFLIAIDQAANVLVCALTLQTGFSDETLSAHAWRARSKPFGRFFLPVIDLMFSVQSPDPDFRDEHGQPITSHCRRAFEKERARRYSPPEERITQEGNR